MKQLRFKSRYPRITIVGDVWRCLDCEASGFVPSRVVHTKKCKNQRPITWSPPRFIMRA